jgi:hypothetical protein
VTRSSEFIDRATRGSSKRPENQGGRDTLWEIRRKFGKRAAKIAEGCSDTLVADPTGKPPWRARKEQYLDHLRGTTSESIFLVSVADKVHNLRSILADYRRVGDKLWDRFAGKRDGTLWYYQELLKIYQEKAPARCADLVEEFERTHRELTALAGQPTDKTRPNTRPYQPSGRSARLFNYHEDDWRNEVLTCRKCGWTGTFEEGSTEVYSELMDCHCPKCHGEDETMLAIVSWSP